MTLNESSFLYIVSALGFLIIVLGIWLWRLEKRIKKVLGNKKSENLEAAILDNYKKLRELEAFRENILKDLNNKEERIKKSIQAIETVRFNPFKGTGDGGNQSFSSALINEKGDGVVFTGLYSRERTSVYAKPLETFEGKFQLSEEEKYVLEKARNKVRKQN